MNREQERRRLIEILNNCPFDRGSLMADFLLSNGIIAPPIKVGDTVYEIFRSRDLRQRNVVEILIGEEPSFVVGGDIYSEERYHFSLFGKTVFLTQEEAEKALKEAKHDRKGIPAAIPRYR